MKKVGEGIFLKDSGIEGNISTIMVGVHGDEISGIDALNELKDKLDIISGKVYLIFANLRAIEKKVRFTEKNLNRCFIKGIKGDTYEEKRAIEIMKILDKSDYLLDVHNMISFNSSLEVLITIQKEYIDYFDVNNVITHIDDVEKGGSDGYMDNIGKKGFCIECGSINYGDKESSKILAKKTIINFLKMTGNIDGKAEKYNRLRKIVKMDYVYKTKTDSFKLNKEFKDFEDLKSGQIVGIDGVNEVIVNNDNIIIFAKNCYKKGEEGFYIGHKI